jgi:hypothetical protein
MLQSRGAAAENRGAHMAYDHGGIEALKPKPNGGRIHQNMTLAEERALLARFARAAGAGEMLNIHDLKARTDWAGHFSVLEPGRVRMRLLNVK